MKHLKAILVALLLSGCTLSGRQLPETGKITSVAPLTAGEVAVANLGRFDFNQYVLHADEILLAKVEDLKSRYVTNEYNDRIIVSTAVLRVERVLKGDVNIGNTANIEVLGGTVDDVTLHVSHVANFEPGERVVVFIARKPTQRTVLGGMFGKLTVNEQNIIVESGQPFQEFAQKTLKQLRKQEVMP